MTYPTFGLSVDQLAAIGSVSVAWAYLDQSTSRFATCMLLPAEHQDIAIIADAVEFRSRIGLIRSIAYNHVEDRGAFDALDKLLVFVESDLRSERNRVTHDQWLSGGEIRVQLKPRFLKSPKQPREMSTYHDTPVQPDDVPSLSRLIDEIAVSFERAANVYSAFPEHIPASWPEIFSPLLEKLNRRYRQTG